jgi:hypothetical protein
MITKKVKSVNDIPNIEHLLNKEFSFGSYVFSDSIRSYYLDIEENKTIQVILISDENEMLSKELLSDLITQENLFYFEWSIFKHYPVTDDLERVERYQWNKQ